MFHTRRLSLVASVGFAALLCGASPSLGQAYLGSSLTPYAVLGGQTVTCTGGSVITGSVGVDPGTATTGFPSPCIGVPIIPPASHPAQLNLVTAYGVLNALTCSSTVGPDLASLTLVPGVYCVNHAPVSNLSGTVHLNGLGDPNAVWVFLMTSDLVTSSGSVVSVENSGLPCGVQWLVRSSATIGSGSTFVGNVVALTSITVNTGANVAGRLLARNGQVALDTNSVSFASCGAGGGNSGAPPPFPGPAGPGGSAIPTLSEIGALALLAVLLGSGAYLLRRRTPTDATT